MYLAAKYIQIFQLTTSCRSIKLTKLQWLTIPLSSLSDERDKDMNPSKTKEYICFTL